MLLWFVITYWIISVGIGLYAATRVHNTKDFAIAGRAPAVLHGHGDRVRHLVRFGNGARHSRDFPARKDCTAWWPIRSAPRCA